MSTALAARRQVENVRKKMKVHAETAERRMAIGAVGALIGFLEKRGTIPLSVANIPTKLALGIAGSLLEANSSGSTRRLAGAAADTALAIYGYQVAKTGAMIAGGEMVAGDEDEL
jgi:hypothetical protein